MGLFSKSKGVSLPPEAFPGQRKMVGTMAEAAKPGALRRIGRAGEPYKGPLVAALSEFEETGLAGLKDWLGTELPTEGVMYKSAADEILKTLSGEEYDPVHGKYYQAYRTGVMRELEEAKDRLAARASAGDKLFGGGRIATEGEMEESALGDLALVLGQLTERERERRLGAVPQALELTEYGERAPLGRVAASQMYGALPRLIEQAEMDAEYQEWMRALNDMGIALDVATGLATYSPGAVVTGGSKSWVQDVAGIMGLVGGIGGLFGGGGGGGSGEPLTASSFGIGW